jgi:ElaB/YqjD/DUF883 family membrane-anchored ribosome-binding protein
MVAASTNMNGKDRQALRKSLRAVRDDVNTLGQDISELAGAVRSNAGSRVRKLRESAEHSAADAIERLQEQVRERPALTIGAAAGAGLLIGLLLAARR